jgi:hypothetical protein
MSDHKKYHLLRTTVTSVLVIGIGALVISYLVAAGIPRAFFAARVQSAGAANNLAVLINNSLANLHRIEQYEKNGSYGQALELLDFELSQKSDKQNAAVILASSIETMAKAAIEIKSSRARGLAVEAVTTGVSMVSRIVNYNASMDQLFIAIQSKLQTGSLPAGVNIRTLLSAINSDGQSINALNNSFNETLKEFDRGYGTDVEA